VPLATHVSSPLALYLWATTRSVGQRLPVLLKVQHEYCWTNLKDMIWVAAVPVHVVAYFELIGERIQVVV
jgi:hypothetical protein